MKTENTEKLTFHQRLVSIQNELKVPKGNYNSFGKYKYRSCEDILEAVKPILLKYTMKLTLTDKIVSIAGKLFLKSSAAIWFEDYYTIVDGYAQIGEHKGMSTEQCTGTASSYARKYALNGLFLIDETEADPDHDKKPEPPKELPTLPESKKESVIDFLVNKGGTIEQIQKKYTLNEMQLNFFQSLIQTKQTK